jgi:hypothetical protein
MLGDISRRNDLSRFSYVSRKKKTLSPQTWNHTLTRSCRRCSVFRRTTDIILHFKLKTNLIPEQITKNIGNETFPKLIAFGAGVFVYDLSRFESLSHYFCF